MRLIRGGLGFQNAARQKQTKLNTRRMSESMRASASGSVKGWEKMLLQQKERPVKSALF